MDAKQILIIFRNVFFKCFLIGFLFLILATILYAPCKCFLATVYQSGFGIKAETYYNLWVSFIGSIKTILIFLFLTPAIALHWTAMALKTKKED